MVLLLITLRHQTWWPGMDATELVWDGWIPSRSVSRGEHPGEPCRWRRRGIGRNGGVRSTLVYTGLRPKTMPMPWWHEQPSYLGRRPGLCAM